MNYRAIICCALWIVTLWNAQAAESSGKQFIGFDKFETFEIQRTTNALILCSPEIHPSISWTELVPSWNFRSARTNGLVFEAQVKYPAHASKWYNLGRWALNPAHFPRESAREQADEDGDVATDTLRMKQPGGAVRIRITLLGSSEASDLRFVGLSFCDTAYRAEDSSASQPLPTRILSVPERSQVDFAEGISSWCSPTVVSMILSFWGQKLEREDLDHDVPSVAESVFDPNWPGTGNWSFNMAFAGAHPGIRAYVTRLNGLDELERWIKSGVPVALSVSYGLLKGNPEPGNGHLVVCVGFTENGDPVINDPGRKIVRQVYSRANLVKAWRKSHNTVYLVYPENFLAPRDPANHWFERKP